jgi:amino acid adenylation domain-containing protein
MSESSHDLQALAPDAKRALLARLLSERAARGSATPAPQPTGIPRIPRDRPLPASFAQHRLWFFEQLVPGTSVYNIHFGLRLQGPLDVAALEEALTLVVQRHEALRTRLQDAAGTPVQVIDPPGPVRLPMVDLCSTAPAARTAAAARHADEEASRPFALADEALFRAALIRLSDDEHHLLLTMHHAVADGLSTTIFVAELAPAYDAITRNQAVALSPLPIQYADFAAWQREQLGGGARLESQLTYWRRRLAGPLPVLDLPSDHTRPATPTFAGGTEVRLLDSDLAAALKALARAQGSTLFMTMLSACAIVWSRLTGDEDLVVGSPIAGRARAETERVVGCFINTLPLRLDLSGRPTFRELLQRVRAVTLEAFEHQDVPFERIADEVQPGRDRSRSPVFQVLFNMLGVGDTWAGHAGGVAFEPLPPLQEPSKFDLTIYAGETAGTIYLRAVYSRDLFEPARITEQLDQLEGVLRQIVADSARPVAEYSLVTARSKELLPDPEATLASVWPGSVVERVTSHAAATPDRVAIRSGDSAWTYAQVHSTSDAVAADLVRAGVRPGARVAVCARRRPEFAVTLLGVWKAGAVFVVLDPAYPPARLTAIVDAASPSAWIDVAGDTPSALRPLVARFDERSRVRVEGPRQSPDATPRVAAAPDDVAYIAFTSGSTGAPKGIVGTHRPVSHFLQWQHDTFEIGPADRGSLLAGLSHDPLLRDVFAPLWAGATLHVPDEGVLDSGAALAAWLSSEAITVCHLTPALGERLAQAGLRSETAALRLVCFGGDALAGRDVERLREFAPGARVVSFYGATETPQAMGWFDVPANGAAAATIPLGQGIEGVQLLVLNGSNALGGIGELGEICVRTPYLAQGYLDGATDAERFTLNPFTGAADDRLYRTGDLGRYGLDGLVHGAGRRDAQVKLRGLRIELGDIEAVLEAHPSVRQALVLVEGDRSADRTLRACCVTHEPRVDVQELRRHLRERLPEAMVPARFSFVETLPLTPNGKIDRRAAAAAVTQEIPANRQFTPPATPVEELVAELWRELLGVEHVGRDDSFFELGGHSLIATRLTSRFHDAFGITFPLRRLFDAPALSNVAVAVTEAMLESELTAEGDPATAELPLADERVWS